MINQRNTESGFKLEGLLTNNYGIDFNYLPVENGGNGLSVGIDDPSLGTERILHHIQ